MCCLLTHGIDDGRIKEPGDQTPELRQKWQQLAQLENQTTSCAASGTDMDQRVTLGSGVLGSSSKVSASSKCGEGDRSRGLDGESGTVSSGESSNHS